MRGLQSGSLTRPDINTSPLSYFKGLSNVFDNILSQVLYRPSVTISQPLAWL